MITAIDAEHRHSSTRPATTRTQTPSKRSSGHDGASTSGRPARAPSTAATTASASPDSEGTPATFRRTELSIRVDVPSRAVRIDVLDATTKAPVRTILLGGHGQATARQSAPLLLDRHV